LRYKDKIKRTYSQIVLNISENKVNGLALRTRNKNLNSANAFKANTTTNTTIVTIVTILNFSEVRYSVSGMVYITDIKNLVVL
jgi:predicted type IV restriction endonuclease